MSKQDYFKAMIWHHIKEKLPEQSWIYLVSDGFYVCEASYNRQTGKFVHRSGMDLDIIYWGELPEGPPLGPFTPIKK